MFLYGLIIPFAFLLLGAFVVALLVPLSFLVGLRYVIYRKE